MYKRGVAKTKKQGSRAISALRLASAYARTPYTTAQFHVREVSPEFITEARRVEATEGVVVVMGYPDENGQEIQVIKGGLNERMMMQMNRLLSSLNHD